MAMGALAQAGEVYSQDFEGAAPFSNWSSSNIVTPSSGGKFLGRIAGNDNVTFDLGTQTGITGLNQYTVSFDLNAIGTLDGSDSIWGSDKFEFGVSGQPKLFSETFANWKYDQSFGGQSQPSGAFGFQSGSAAVNSLGLTEYPTDLGLDSTYKLSFTFEHDGPLVLSFGANGLESFDNESFGIDNLKVSATPVPEPTSMAVLGLGAIAMLARRKKKN